ncbi:hypothetical protein CPT_Michonne15 [Citrobacter phage Michonne]|uniref:Uncharacterized protein n=3 Tax=Mooglevirus TaxID=1985303 RepID=A0AAE8Z2Y2_9CAUD|nr:hypothetical protein CPT_Michonne_gp015 [Citrobacter phage Michonne]YP_009606653.1 hypothetical protein FDI02_gp069 [Citrobacter phage Mordin]AYR00759.1 hypothetical protein CPT_Maleficent_015 [Citrobacter phage Maleficent]UHS65486.1 hypothetical protein HP1_94 [Citrobacter phage vB_CbrM_HP1]AKU43964.1 hypothetical protein CPT_Michonne15 [Citrobacter phage Michonne]ALA06833.1 hypothetical protein Mordin_17 [Citrobacter phage Mordin]
MLEIGKVYLFVAGKSNRTFEAVLKHVSEDKYTVSWQAANGVWYDEEFTKNVWKVYQEVTV